MAATLELKYFNSFWLKKLDTIVDVVNTTATITSNIVNTNIITLSAANPKVSVGQALTWVGGTLNIAPTVVYVSGATVTLNLPVTIDQYSSFGVLTILSFGPLTDFSHIPAAAQYTSGPADWFLEESHIRGGYDNTDIDLGVKAYIVEPDASQQHLASSMIYSGVFNSRTGTNNTNQFSVADDITRAVDPSQGSIQKLYAEDTNLIIFQEEKVSRALIDKDAIYSAEGQPMTTSGASVIGQIQAYSGNYGIGTNPESFAVYGYRKYFADKSQNAILRLSQDGITEISGYGMLDFFRDNLSMIGNTGKIIGSWDMHNKQYVISLQPANTDYFKTLCFDEDVSGWTSLFSFKPSLAGSLLDNYYTFKKVTVENNKTFGTLWKHYADPVLTNTPYANFYGVQYNSTITFVFNPNVSANKNFNTLNYEGTIGWKLVELYSNSDTALPIGPTIESFTLADLENQLFSNNFKRKEDKFFGTIINNTAGTYGEIVYGKSMSGIKGFFTTATMAFVNPPEYNYVPKMAQLYSVSSEYVDSSY